MNLAIVLLITALVAVTLLPLSKSQHWIVRVLDFPRVQFFTVAVVLFVVQLQILDFHEIGGIALVFLTVLCLIWQAWCILPYTPIWPTEAKRSSTHSDGMQLSILISNVLTPNRRAHELVSLVEKCRPDVLVTLESDDWWESKLSEIENDMPYTVKCPLDNLYGMHLYSRLELTDCEILFLVEENVPSIHATITLGSGEKVRAHFVHPAPPSPTQNETSSERDAELIVIAKTVANTDMPVIVTGDLNDVAWSATTRLFRRISGLLDPRIGRGVFNTFHVNYPFLRWPLDHIFHSSHFTVSALRRLPSIGSDHFPLFAKLTLEPNIRAGQKEPELRPQDQDWADEIIAGENVDEADLPPAKL